ncbi:hypothetical protein [Pseudomonas xanthosomatis]|uniref:hypothetical protein n=1 Tax=Pseudomonas xanthosomatis TaxID=2842356 RepID=UPI003516E100
MNWLKEPGRLLGNDMVFAIDKAKADALLTQEYIRRFKTTSYLPPVNGETAADNGYKVYMQHFVLDHPRLSFDNADITSTKASLRMKLVGGNQVDLKQVGAHWYPQRIDSIDPLVGPELSLKLELSDVPGYVDDDGRIMFDLRNSSNFVLTFSDSNRVRQLGGDFFKELFLALPDDKRVWSIGQIDPVENTFLRPEFFRLRTQRNPAALFSPLVSGNEADVDGAVLGLVRMRYPLTEDYALPGPTYRYLIPSGQEGYSATAMFSKWRIALGGAVKNLYAGGFRGMQFREVSIAGHYISSYAESGRLDIPDMRYSYVHMADVPPGHTKQFLVDVGLHVAGLRFQLGIGGGAPYASVLLHGENSVFSYLGSVFEARNFSIPVILTRISDSLGLIAPGDYVGREYRMNFHVLVTANWAVPVNDGDAFRLTNAMVFVGSEPAGPGAAEFSSFEKGSQSKQVANDYIESAVRGAALKGLERMLDVQLKPFLETSFLRSVYTDDVISDFVGEAVKLNFGEKVFMADYHLPHEVAGFGHANPQLTSFSVNPLEKNIVQGSKLQFVTVPGGLDVTWSAESVEGSSDAPGEFSKTVKGEYLAPSASGIQGNFTRVRITATDPSTGYSASALVSVVKNALSLSPLVELCQVGDTGVSLKAGHVGQGELRWKVLGSAPHGRLAHTAGQANTYIPGGNLTGKAFVVEQVEVSNSQTHEQRTLCVITQMTDMRPTDVVTVKQDAQAGRVWLALSAGTNVGVSELSVVHGPGTIGEDAAGPYYQADSASSAPFCVVRAFWEPMPGFPMVFEGFIVLPLPLAGHSAAYQALEQAGQRVMHRLTGATA